MRTNGSRLVIASVLMIIPLQTGCIEPLLDQACNQYGYNAAVRDRELNYGVQRYSQNVPIDTIITEIQARLADQLTQCRTGEPRSAIVRHVTVATQLPTVVGATYLDNNFLISPESNLTYYQSGSARGPLQTSTRFGMKTLRVGIAVNGNANTDPEGINESLAWIQRARLAGYVNVWPSLYLRPNCCGARNTVPPALRVGAGTPPNVNVVANNVRSYAQTTMGRLLDESELPIVAVALGNEIDGGFWRDLDASESYAGPPAHVDQTKRIMQAARDGIELAYASRGLQRPYFILHVMPGLEHGYAQNVTDLAALVDSSHVNENLFDVVAFSFYPNARGLPLPLAAADHLADLAATTGLPWLIAEGGFAQEPVTDFPGVPIDMYPMNNFTKVADCPSLLGVSCSSGQDMQSKMLTRTTDILRAEPTFRGFTYLAPQDNARMNNFGTIQASSGRYRLSLWVDTDVVNYNTTSTVAGAPALTAFKTMAQSLAAPVASSPTFSCPSSSACVVRFSGRNFQANAAIDALDPATDKSVRYHVHQASVHTPSRIEVTISPADANRYISTGLEFRVVNPGSSFPDTTTSWYFARR